MIWCNKDKYNFISKLLKTNNKEVLYLKNLIEREDVSEEVRNLVSEFFLVNNNYDLKKFVNSQNFFKFDFSDDMLSDDFMENKEKVAYAIVEAILTEKM